jgi:hypothetical protein
MQSSKKTTQFASRLAVGLTQAQITQHAKLVYDCAATQACFIITIDLVLHAVRCINHSDKNLKQCSNQ